MKYDIVAADKRFGLVTVRFLTDTQKFLTELKIPVPIVDGAYSLQRLQDVINHVSKSGMPSQVSPADLEARLLKVQSVLNFDDVQAIVNVGTTSMDDHFNKTEQRQFIEAVLEEPSLIKTQHLRLPYYERIPKNNNGGSLKLIAMKVMYITLITVL